MRSISISFAFLNRLAYLSLITQNGSSKLQKLYPGGFADYTYPQFQNSQEVALDGGVILDILVNSNKFHVDGVLILAR